MLKTIEDIPPDGFIPEHLSQWAKISVFMSDVPAVELDLNENGGLIGCIKIKQSVDIEITAEDEARFDPCALFVLQENKTEVCVFDIAKHGWDAVECDYRPDGPTKLIEVGCKACGAKGFSVRVPWLGYQVFDEGPPTPDGSIKYRNSFDSIAIEIKCLSCNVVEEILNAETA